MPFLLLAITIACLLAIPRVHNDAVCFVLATVAVLCCIGGVCSLEA